MKTWTYFYVEHAIKNGEIFRKESGVGIKELFIKVKNKALM